MNDKKVFGTFENDDIMRLVAAADELANNSGSHLGDDAMFLYMTGGENALNTEGKKHLDSCLYCRSRLAARQDVFVDACRHTETLIEDRFLLKAAADHQAGESPVHLYSEKWRFELNIMPIDNMAGEGIITFSTSSEKRDSFEGRHISICDARGLSLLDGIVRQGVLRKHYDCHTWCSIWRQIDLSVLTLVKLEGKCSGESEKSQNQYE